MFRQLRILAEGKYGVASGLEQQHVPAPRKEDSTVYSAYIVAASQEGKAYAASLN